MVHAALIVGCLAVAAIAFAIYMWDTRVERREFARRLERAERVRTSMSGGRLPRGGPRA
jgi:Flp pilus assembly protein TadB